MQVNNLAKLNYLAVLFARASFPFISRTVEGLVFSSCFLSVYFLNFGNKLFYPVLDHRFTIWILRHLQSKRHNTQHKPFLVAESENRTRPRIPTLLTKYRIIYSRHCWISQNSSNNQKELSNLKMSQNVSILFCLGEATTLAVRNVHGYQINLEFVRNVCRRGMSLRMKEAVNISVESHI